MKNSVLGNKYYRYINDNELEIVRVKKIQNNVIVSIEIESTKERKKVHVNELKEKYILLKADGYISFTIAKLEDDVKDVIIALHRRSDILENNNVPYCVCRQNIMDVHANRIVQTNMKYVGACVSVETIPDDTPYEVMIACNGIEVFSNAAIYMDDTLDIILSLIQDKKYNIILEDLYNRSKDTPYLTGYTKTIRQLLTENNFMYDFRRAFNIIPLAFKIELVSNDEDQVLFQDVLSPNNIENLEHLFGHRMNDIYVLKYHKDIDLSKIQRNYILVCDSIEGLYVIVYEKGESYTNSEYLKHIKNLNNYLSGIPVDRSKYQK